MFIEFDTITQWVSQIPSALKQNFCDITHSITVHRVELIRFFERGLLTELPNLGSFHSRASQVSSNFSVASLSTIIPISSHVRAVPIRLNAFRQEAHH